MIGLTYDWHLISKQKHIFYQKCYLKGMTEDEMVGWHHRLDGHEFEQAPELVTDWEACHATIHGAAKSWT